MTEHQEWRDPREGWTRSGFVSSARGLVSRVTQDPDSRSGTSFYGVDGVPDDGPDIGVREAQAPASPFVLRGHAIDVPDASDRLLDSDSPFGMILPVVPWTRLLSRGPEAQLDGLHVVDLVLV